MPGLSIWKDKRISRLKKDMDNLFERVFGDFGMQANSKKEEEKKPARKSGPRKKSA